jgi:transcriptional regulator with XRE-family HTH domain
MNTTKFNTVAAAAAHLAEDAAVEKRVKSEITRNALVSLLLETRVQKGVTQEKIAESMGCDASTVSRIESGNDRQLKWPDIIGYAGALGLQMSILFDDESLPAAARIKQCVFKIDDDLKKLATLAEQVDGDSEIVQGIARFYKEVLFNFLSRFSENRDKLSAVVKIPAKVGQRLAERTETCDPQAPDRLSDTKPVACEAPSPHGG